MKHRIKSNIFNRSTKHRKMMIRNLVRSLFEHGEIKTTKTKAKETKRWADKLIHLAQEDSISAKRKLHKFFGKRDVVNALTQSIAPAMKDRKSGFTSLEVLGKRRGDNAMIARLTLIKKPAQKGFAKTLDK